MSHALSIGTVGGVDAGEQRSTSQPEVIRMTYAPVETATLRRVLDEAEVQAIQRALQHTGWNRKRAAALLKISYRGLLYKIRRHSITPPSLNE